VSSVSDLPEQRQERDQSKKRDRSQPAQINRASSKHPLKSMNCACRNKCSEKIDMQARQIIHEQFWQLNYNERRNFMFSRIKNSKETVSGGPK